MTFQRSPARAAVRVAAALTASAALSEAYTSTSFRPAFLASSQHPSRATCRRPHMIFAPPGSGYATPDEEESPFPDTYEPMMEYPGTMRPGRTPEDQPFHDLPIGDDDPDPVPWPHFQQIEWHHRWDPPHEHPIPMEEFIELQGRWATPEMEAAMRAGARRDVRERREQAESEKKATLIMDDDEDEVVEEDEPVALGDGMFGQLGSIAEDAVTAAAVAPPSETEETEEVGEEVEDDFDDFLLDLGLDADLTDDEEKSPVATAGDDEGDDGVDLSLDLGLLDDDEDDEVSANLDMPLDFGNDDDDAVTTEAALDPSADIDFDEDETDAVGMDDEGVTMVPLEAFGDDSDSIDEEDSPFDDGGFDYDDGDLDLDDGDVW